MNLFYLWAPSEKNRLEGGGGGYSNSTIGERCIDAGFKGIIKQTSPKSFLNSTDCMVMHLRQELLNSLNFFLFFC